MKLVKIADDTFINPSCVISISKPDHCSILPPHLSNTRSTVRGLVGDKVWTWNSDRDPAELAAELAA